MALVKIKNLTKQKLNPPFYLFFSISKVEQDYCYFSIYLAILESQNIKIGTKIERLQSVNNAETYVRLVQFLNSLSILSPLLFLKKASENNGVSKTNNIFKKKQNQK